MKNGCPEGCGVCDACGSSVCLDGSSCGCGTKVESEENGVNLEVFAALAEFVALLTENVDLEVEILPLEGKQMIRSIVDAAVLMTLTEMAAMDRTL